MQIWLDECWVWVESLQSAKFEFLLLLQEFKCQLAFKLQFAHYCIKELKLEREREKEREKKGFMLLWSVSCIITELYNEIVAEKTFKIGKQAQKTSFKFDYDVLKLSTLTAIWNVSA